MGSNTGLSRSHRQESVRPICKGSGSLKGSCRLLFPPATHSSTPAVTPTLFLLLPYELQTSHLHVLFMWSNANKQIICPLGKLPAWTQRKPSWWNSSISHRPLKVLLGFHNLCKQKKMGVGDSKQKKKSTYEENSGVELSLGMSTRDPKAQQLLANRQLKPTWKLPSHLQKHQEKGKTGKCSELKKKMVVCKFSGWMLHP